MSYAEEPAKCGTCGTQFFTVPTDGMISVEFVCKCGVRWEVVRMKQGNIEVYKLENKGKAQRSRLNK